MQLRNIGVFTDVINEGKELGSMLALSAESSKILESSLDGLSSAQILSKVSTMGLTDAQKLELIQLYALDSAIDKKEFIGNCTGNKMEGKFDSVKEAVIVNVIAHFKTKEGEEMYIGYGMSEPSSYTVVIIVAISVVSLVILCLIGLLIKRMNKKKKEVDILEFEKGKINVGELERRSASLLD